MTKRVLILALASMFIFAGMAMAFDVAISTQAGWYSQDAATREMDELVAAIQDNPSIGTVDVYTDADQAALATWVTNHTNDGNADILILNGQFPDTIYEPGNAQEDGSIAEMYLDAGNTIFNTGDYMFYVVNSAGTNGEGGIQAMMDIPMTLWDDDTPVVVTADGATYTPTLTDFNTDRPFHLDELDAGWEPLVILAQNDAGTRADPCIVKNANTGGMLGIFYQTASQDDDPRSEVIGEFINSYYSTTAVSPVDRLTTSWGAVKK